MQLAPHMEAVATVLGAAPGHHSAILPQRCKGSGRGTNLSHLPHREPKTS